MAATSIRSIRAYGRAWGIRKLRYPANSSPVEAVMMEFFEIQQLRKAYTRYQTSTEAQYAGKGRSMRELIQNAARKASSQLAVGAGTDDAQGPGGQVSQAALVGRSKAQSAAGGLGVRGIIGTDRTATVLEQESATGSQGTKRASDEDNALDPSGINPPKVLRGSKQGKFQFAPKDTKLANDGNPQSLYKLKVAPSRRDRRKADFRIPTVSQSKRLKISGY